MFFLSASLLFAGRQVGRFCKTMGIPKWWLHGGDCSLCRGAARNKAVTALLPQGSKKPSESSFCYLNIDRFIFVFPDQVGLSAGCHGGKVLRSSQGSPLGMLPSVLQKSSAGALLPQRPLCRENVSKGKEERVQDTFHLKPRTQALPDAAQPFPSPPQPYGVWRALTSHVL